MHIRHKTKKTSHGPLVKIGHSQWQSKQSKPFDCTWMESNSVSFIRLKISRYIGHVRDRDPAIHQDLTNTPCTLARTYCRPEEKSLSIITWVFKLPTFQIFQSLGIFNVSQIHQYVIIPKLAIGGSIIKKTPTSFLLDTGYIIKKIRPRSIKNLPKILPSRTKISSIFPQTMSQTPNHPPKGTLPKAF